MKARVILDIAFLGHAHRARSERRGAQRVVSHLFEGLAASQECDLSFVATSHLLGVFEFLSSRSMASRQRLRYSRRQLPLSRAGTYLSDLVNRNLRNRSFTARACRRAVSLVAATLTRGEFNLSLDLVTNADIYHSPHGPFPEAIKSNSRLKKFITLHDFIPLVHPEYVLDSALPFMNAVLACLTPQNFAFCVSAATRDDALNMSHIPPDHVFITPLAADKRLFFPVSDRDNIFDVLTRHRIPEEPYFLALSAQDRHKNFPHLIRCFGALAESGELRNTNLVIVGANPGRNKEVIEALEQFPKVRPRIIVPGFVPDEDLAAIYSGADAFLFPSLAEGFGIPPLEAMQCGTPVLASNTTSIPEVVGNAGILLPPTDQDAWCNAILKVSQNGSLRQAMRERSLERAKLFSWERFITETLRGYRTSLERV